MAQVDREKLRSLIAASGKSARAISLAANLGSTAVRDILNGRSHDPGAATLLAIAEQLDVSLDDLLQANQENPRDAARAHKVVPRYLPVRYKVQAGLWYEVDADEPPEQIDHPVMPNPRFAQWPQWLELVVGDSANEKISAGQYAHVVDACEMGYAPRNGDWVIVERRRGATRERTIKQVEVRGSEVLLWPRSTNPKWKEPVVLIDGVKPDEDIEVEIVGLVIGAYNKDF